ncbi:MAG TPA: hypothetical protein VFB76_20000 [Candidatus Angelobacter sp.]|nr:hypothetical protein [Candidatus Angelobacter sp.]
MKSAWIAYPLVLGPLLLTAPMKLAARSPKPANPCHNLKTDLDHQVNGLHKRQDDELSQCRHAQGKDSSVCRDLQGQQKNELQTLRDQRETELNNCSLRANRLNSNSGQINALDNNTYNTYPYERDHRHKHHEPPYKHPKDPNKNPPSVAHNPPSHNGGGNKLSREPEENAPKNTGNSAARSSHLAGSGSFHSGSSNSNSRGGSSGSSSSHSSSSSSSNSNSSSHSEAGTSRPK